VHSFRDKVDDVARLSKGRANTQAAPMLSDTIKTLIAFIPHVEKNVIGAPPTRALATFGGTRPRS